MSIQVNSFRCPQNHPCPSVRICPVNALKQTGFNAPVYFSNNIFLLDE